MAQNGSYFNFTDKVAIVTGASLSREEWRVQIPR